MTKILFCEDDRLTRKLIEVTFRTSPYEILLAADGLEGFELIERTRPDLVFVDLLMPGMGGLQVCQALKKRPELANIPVILLTASEKPSDLEEAYRCGVLTHFLKPFSPTDLREKVDALIISIMK